MKNQSLFVPILIMLVSVFSLEAQPAGDPSSYEKTITAKVQIRGKVIDAGSGDPLEFAAVSLFTQQDSMLVDGIITNEQGLFMLEANPGNYFLKIEFLSYQGKVLDNLVLDRKTPVVDLGDIPIQMQAAALDEVLVTAEQSQMQLSLDKKVFNVGKDLSLRGGTAADLLDNVPSVQVDVEGNVSLRGSQNVRILVNGKPSGLIGISGANGLRQLQANMIDRVEVITNASARYEAEGTAGIINIVLKKDQEKGFNGSFDLNAGQPDNYGTALNLNFRTEKLNFFANYGLSYRNGPGRGDQYQETYREDTTFITVQDNERRRGGWNNTLRLGSDYFFNPKNVLTSAFTYRRGDEKNRSETEYRDFIFDLNNPVGITVRTDDQIEKENNLEYSLTYKRTFDRKGQEFTADLRYQDNSEKQGSDLRNRFFTPEFNPENIPDLFQRSDNNESEKQLVLQMDYVHPFSKEGKFEAGLRSSFRDIGNDYLVTELNDNVWEVLEGLSNNFQYDENIHAAYLLYGNKYGRFSYQIGLRPEYSQVTTRLLQTDEVNDRDYLNLFPSAHVNYELPGQNAIQISYSRRVRRPRFWDLNPFFTFSDNRNFRSGNPDLDPEFTNSMEVGHIKYWDKASLSTSIYYRHTDGKIERIRRVDADGNSVTRPENLATEDAFGFEFTTSYEPFKWWKVNADFNFFRAMIDGGNLDQTFASDTYSWFTRGTSRFTIKKKTDVQVRFDYRAPEQRPQGSRKSLFGMDLAASRDIFQDKGTLTLSVRDVFNTRRYRFTSEGENFYTESSFQWRGRQQVILSLNYRLNQAKRRNSQRGEGGYEGGDEGVF